MAHTPVLHPPFRSDVAARRRVASGGRFMLCRDATEHRCQTVDVTLTGAALRAAVHVRAGERVICYLDDYGRLEGTVAGATADGFAVDFTSPPAQRQRLAARLASRTARSDAASVERQFERIAPVHTRVVLRTHAGRRIASTLLNLSRSGAALACPATLMVGEPVTVGRLPAAVVRAGQRLVAVAFDMPIDEAAFTPDIVL